MNGTINLCVLIGNLGQDPEVRYTASGACIATVSLATTYRRNKDSENQTEWHNVKFIGKLAEIARDILYKGAKVYIEAKSQTESWQHKDYPHVKMYRQWFMANSMELLSPFRGDEDKTTKAHYGHLKPAPNVKSALSQDSPEMNPRHEDFDDDIPF